MNEIKFRGYHKFTGNPLYLPDKRWVYGYFYKQDGKCYIKDISDMSLTYVVEPESVGRFIGLTDKNGNEIYKGDILKATSNDLIWYYLITTLEGHGNNLFAVTRYRNFKVDITDVDEEGGWSSGDFYVNEGHRILTEHDTVEIIGNTYENPELIGA